MKILHTSDWHLGQQFFDYDRTAEHQSMLSQITAIIRQERPDALLVSGDVFHTGNPSVKAVELYNRALLEMHAACQDMQIVVTAGNHDSASRLTVNNDLWNYFQVNVIGNVAKNDDAQHTPDYDKHIITIADSDGNVKGYVAAVPHCYESNFPAADDELQRTERAKAYFKGLLEAVGQKNVTHMPVVLMAHMAVSGTDFSGHDCIGGMETRDLDVLGEGYDYVALGHIHTPQSLSDRVRYSGSPIPVNFGERYEHSVTIVTLSQGQKPIIETRKIHNPIPLVDFPTPLPQAEVKEDQLDEDERPLPFTEVLARLREYPDDKVCYMRLVVKVDSTLSPLANTLVAEETKGKQCRVCRIQPFAYKTEAAERQKTVNKMTGTELNEKTPLEIAELFFSMKGIQLTPRQKDMIQEATIKAQQINNEDHEA